MRTANKLLALLPTLVALATLTLFAALASCGGSENGLTGDNTGDDAANATDGAAEASRQGEGGNRAVEAGHDGTVDASDGGAGGGIDSGRDVAVDAMDAGRLDAARDATADVVDAGRSDADAAIDGSDAASVPDVREAAVDATGEVLEAGEEASTEDAAEDAAQDAAEDVVDASGGGDEGSDGGDGAVASAPDAPTGLVATASDGAVSLTWTAPPGNASPITNYTVAVSPNAGTLTMATPTSTSATVSGLTNGTQYTFTVTATNGAGTSGPSAPAIATPAGVPSAPMILTVVPGNASATVTWTMPADNGSPIQGYTVTSTPGNVLATTTGAASTSVAVAVLSNCTSYTFTVTATNSVGSSQPSATSSPPVTPVPGSTVGYSTNIQQAIFTAGYFCTTCHGGAGGLTLAYDNIVSVPAMEDSTIDYITPGDPGHSYLWCKVNPTDTDCATAGTVIIGRQMPLGGQPLSSTDLVTLKTWIQQCAQNN
jgi:Fibronectin type III domain